MIANRKSICARGGATSTSPAISLAFLRAGGPDAHLAPALVVELQAVLGGDGAVGDSATASSIGRKYSRPAPQAVSAAMSAQDEARRVTMAVSHVSSVPSPRVGAAGRDSRVNLLWHRDAVRDARQRAHLQADTSSSERILVMDGLNDDVYEVFDPNPPGQWATWGPSAVRTFNGPDPIGLANLFLYPRVHQLSNGKLFRSGMTLQGCVTYHSDGPNAGPNPPWPVWSPRDVTSSATFGNPPAPVTMRLYGASVPFPNLDALHTDAVMVLGGEQPAPGPTQFPTPLSSVEICKPTASAPGPFDPPVGQPQGYDWSALPSMSFPRVDPNAVILPDGSVTVFGGGDYYTGVPGNAVLHPVNYAERFKGGVWQLLAQSTSFRTYHSVALLLPDGRVLLAGGDTRSWDYEIYEPPYLTMGLPRPSFVTSPPPTLSYNTQYTVQVSMAAGATVSKVVLMRPGSVTHHFDFAQRYVEMSAEVILPPAPLDGKFVQFTTPIGPPKQSNPSNARTAPPGWWMMFLVSENGVPSTAKWVRFDAP